MCFEPSAARFLVRQLMFGTNHHGVALDGSPVRIARRRRRRAPAFVISAAKLEARVVVEDVGIADAAGQRLAVPVDIDEHGRIFVAGESSLDVPRIGSTRLVRWARGLLSRLPRRRYARTPKRNRPNPLHKRKLRRQLNETQLRLFVDWGDQRGTRPFVGSPKTDLCQSHRGRYGGVSGQEGG